MISTSGAVVNPKTQFKVFSKLCTTANNLENWANQTGFQFSPEKPSCNIFTKKKEC
jgi:hypothetical protein